jgi:hypothetical protein
VNHYDTTWIAFMITFYWQVTQKYDWRSLYIIHIISGGLFFAAFSIVCIQWSSLLKFGSYVKILFSRNVIIIINFLFIILDLAAIVMCAMESSLVDFFESDFFYVYIFGDALKNISFSLLLAFYGIRLIMKFYRYSTIELNENEAAGVFNRNQSVFSTALSRLTVTVIIASFCFVTRLVMLILKSIALNSDDTITSEKFTLFGFYWFCFSDFIPRVLPSITFVLLMRSKRRGIKRELDSTLSKGLYSSRPSMSGGARFTYVGDEEDYDEDDSGDEYYSDDDDDTESVSLFDPPPGSFIHDKEYASSPFGGHYNNLSTGDDEFENDDEFSRHTSSTKNRSGSSRVRKLSDEDIAAERRRHESNAATANEMSLTSFKHLAGGGKL